MIESKDGLAEVRPEVRELVERMQAEEESSPTATNPNGNIRVLGGGLSLGLIEDEGINKPALVMSIQYATLLSNKDMEAIIETMSQMKTGIIVAQSTPVDLPKMGMIKGGRKH